MRERKKDVWYKQILPLVLCVAMLVTAMPGSIQAEATTDTEAATQVTATDRADNDQGNQPPANTDTEATATATNTTPDTPAEEPTEDTATDTETTPTDEAATQSVAPANTVLAAGQGDINLDNYTGKNLYIYDDGYTLSDTDPAKNATPTHTYPGDYTLTGGTADAPLTNRVIIMEDYRSDSATDDRTITLNGLHLQQTTDTSPFDIRDNGFPTNGSGAVVNLNLEGINTLGISTNSDITNAVLCVARFAKLTIDGSGSLDVTMTGTTTQAAGIGANRPDEMYQNGYNAITINGGTVNVRLTGDIINGAGIGGSNYGGYTGEDTHVTINGGTVDVQLNGNTINGAGIGGGNESFEDTHINIAGGRVSVVLQGNTAEQATNHAAGIGGGNEGRGTEYVTIAGGTIDVRRKGGATRCRAIGPGDGTGETAFVRITGGSVCAETEDDNGTEINDIANPRAASGDDRSLTCNIITLQGVADDVNVNNQLSISDYDYGLTDVVTTDGAENGTTDSKLYLWLPETTTDATIRYTGDNVTLSRTYTRNEITGYYNVTLLPAATYTVTIPATVSMVQQSDGTLSGTAQVAVESLANFSDGRNLNVSVSSSDGFALVDTVNGRLAYTINNGAITNGGSVLTNVTEKATADLKLTSEQLRYSGNYTDTLTFQVTVDEGVTAILQ